MDKRIKLLRRLKLVAFIVLIFSVFLPFSSCTRTWDKSRYADVHPENRPPLEVREVTNYETGETFTKEVHVVKSVKWLFSDPELFEAEFWLLLLSFWWPFLILILVKTGFGDRYPTLLTVGEGLCSILAGVNIFFSSTFLNTPEIGAYISTGANVLILLIVITEGYFKFKNRSTLKNQPTEI